MIKKDLTSNPEVEMSEVENPDARKKRLLWMVAAFIANILVFYVIAVDSIPEPELETMYDVPPASTSTADTVTYTEYIVLARVPVGTPDEEILRKAESIHAIAPAPQGDERVIVRHCSIPVEGLCFYPDAHSE